MAIQFRLRAADSIPIEVTGVLPEAIGTGDLAEMERQRVVCGNREVAVGDLFEVCRVEAPPTDVPIDGIQTAATERDIELETHFWVGPLDCVHDLGAEMQAGVIRVEGSLGDRVGREMSGGRIEIQGDVRDHAGQAMTGGVLLVRGNAQDGLGGSLAGSPNGMNGGAILVGGRVGDETGVRMRRGVVLIAGDSGYRTGWQMRAGTVLVGGRSAGPVGQEMVRGTLIVRPPQPVDLTFRSGRLVRPVWLAVLRRWLDQIGGRAFDLSLLEGPTYRSYHGDFTRGGRGEILVFNGLTGPCHAPKPNVLREI